MMDFEKMPILQGLENYWKEKNTRFHMPGHKGRRKGFSELDYIRENLYALDVTEVEGTDNLYAPGAMIAKAQRMLAVAMKAEKSYFLVNGSTCGNYAAILGLTERKDKVLVQRNCHKSVYNALYLGDLEPIYLYPEYVPSFAFPSGLSFDTVKQAIEDHPEARALILTHPTYYGTCCDLKNIAAHCRQKGVLLIVDEAHGAHFPFSPFLPESAMEAGADISVTSFHKTLPSLTQTAVLNLNQKLTTKQIQKIHQMLSLFQTTSPSYLFLASIDAARHIMQCDGEALLAQLKIRIDRFVKKLVDFPDIQVLREKDLKNETKDFTRIVINTPMNGEDLSRILRETYYIQAEMFDSHNLIFIGSIFDEEEDYEKLAIALKEIFSKNKPSQTDYDSSLNHKGSQEMDPMPKPLALFHPRQVDNQEQEEIELSDCIGRISAEQVVPYPPGIPLLIPGEMIDEKVLDYWNKIRNSGTRIMKNRTTRDSTIMVIKS